MTCLWLGQVGVLVRVCVQLVQAHSLATVNLHKTKFITIYCIVRRICKLQLFPRSAMCTLFQNYLLNQQFVSCSKNIYQICNLFLVPKISIGPALCTLVQNNFLNAAIYILILIYQICNLNFV